GAMENNRALLEAQCDRPRSDLHWAVAVGMELDPIIYAGLNNSPSHFYTTAPDANAMHQDMPGTHNEMINPLLPTATTSVDPSVITNQPISMTSMQPTYSPHMQQMGCQSMGSDHLDPFGQAHTFAPAALLHRNSDLGPLTQDNSFAQQLRRGSAGMITDHKQLHFQEQDFYNEDFRFRTVLRASTAMIKDPDEIPITYLNKGQAYSLNIFDTAAMNTHRRPTKYRTYVRVSFEEEEQRSRPAGCWQLWQEGRGANEAHHRAGKLLAVEHVDPNQGGDGEIRHQQVKLEKEFFDGFYVTWTPNRANGQHECTISVRFNFLSTDFSHSKGVKGIPVRLCAKTQVVSDTTECPRRLDYAEVAYCKVKLFRDHGAERKLSNDATHVKKQIDKIKSQIAQAESGSSSGEKRKRSGSISSRGGSGNKINKTPKSKRSWSQGQGEKPPFEDDLHARLRGYIEMFSSVRQVSVLNLKGDPQDDPDLFPVSLETSHDSTINGVEWDQPQIATDGGISQSFSPTSSHRSLTSSLDVKAGTILNRPMFEDSRNGSVDWSGFASHDPEIQQHFRNSQVLNHPVKIQRQDASDAGDGWFEAMGVDPNYNPPSDTVVVPKHCFYAKNCQNENDIMTSYHHAIYIQNRNAQEFTDALVRKWKINPAKITETIQVRDDGLRIAVDDDFVQELPEGKDMTVEFVELRDGSEDPNMDLDAPISPRTVGKIEIRLKI
ncbi:hypothetical protein FQN49_005585, partial [Arthroderma sp. PD_2]